MKYWLVVLVVLMGCTGEKEGTPKTPKTESMTALDKKYLKEDKERAKDWAVRDLNKDIKVNRARGRELTKLEKQLILQGYERQFFLKLRASRRAIKLGRRHNIQSAKVKEVFNYYIDTLKHTDDMPTDEEILARLKR